MPIPVSDSAVRAVSDCRIDGRHAFVTGLNGDGMVDLNSLVDLLGGVALGDAVLINNSGQVVVYPQIPEPKIYVMILFGLGLIGLFASRKKAENPRMNMGTTLTA